MSAPETAHMGEGLLPVVPWQPRIGEEVQVIGECAADWRKVRLWVAGVRVPDDADGLEVTVAEQWPIPHRHFGGYKGQTDDFRVGSTKRPDDLCPISATPTALPSAEDVLSLVREQFALESEADRLNSTATEIRRGAWDNSRAMRTMIAVVNALQSPRASDEVLGEAGGAGLALEHLQFAREYLLDGSAGTYLILREIEKAEKALSASPVPVDASGVGERYREALLQIEFLSTNHGGWFEHDAWEWGQLMGNTARDALSHTAPVADAQAGEGDRG